MIAIMLLTLLLWWMHEQAWINGRSLCLLVLALAFAKTVFFFGYGVTPSILRGEFSVTLRPRQVLPFLEREVFIRNEGEQEPQVCLQKLDACPLEGCLLPHRI